MDKLAYYKRVAEPLPERNRIWPLYGAGFENLGKDGNPIDVPMPTIGPDELLVRHDACGLCFSDIKVIKTGQNHPRIYRDMSQVPVILGHEISMTVVQAGENLKNQYKPGDRYIVQADIFIDGVGYAYGYEIQGGLSRYNVIDQRVLNGDDGNYLLPVQADTGYAESALTEPWACVIAAYQLSYRTGLKPGGTTWIIGAGASREYTISQGFDVFSHPERLLLTGVPEPFTSWLKTRSQELGIAILEDVDLQNPPVEFVDDLVILGADASVIETASPYLANHGICAILSETPLPRNINTDVGRIHYNRWVYIGTTSTDVASAYASVPVRSTLKAGGKSWFVGAGGPMGRMHVQRAIQIHHGPATIVCSDVSDLRLDDLCTSFSGEAQAKGIDFICLNPTRKDEYLAALKTFLPEGFDDIIVLAPIGPVVAEAYDYLADKGVMNVFAGLPRGSMVNLNLSDAFLRQTRLIGHSASSIDDLRLMLHQAESGELSPNRSVAAIGSLNAAKDGLNAVLDTSFPGKVVIFPQIKDLPLTALSDLKEKMPSVYALLKDGREWTVEAENEFLRLMLP
jgi:D-arabinose 1-dehydrogenase-like Zn-dependent alcohol dehydrogenase